MSVKDDKAQIGKGENLSSSKGWLQCYKPVSVEIIMLYLG